MKKIIRNPVTKFSFILLALVFINNILNAQVLTEHVIPQYFGSKSANGTNNCRTPFAVCLQISGLTPNTAYDVQIGIGLVTDAATVYGAGNIWNRNRNSFSGQRDTLAFTTDANGDSGPFWSFLQPTGNASRFDAGQIHNLRIGYTLTGGSFSGTPSFITAKQLTALDIPVTPRTVSTSDDGAFVNGYNIQSASGKYVLIFNDTAGTGNPLSVYQIRVSSATNTSQSELPAKINDIYLQNNSNSSVGEFAGVVPIGANNPSGVRRIEIRNSDNSVFIVAKDDDGIWQFGTNPNTATLARRDVGDFYVTSSLQLNYFIEGFYNSAANSMVADSAVVYLHSNSSPYNLIDFSKSILNSGGTGYFNFTLLTNGSPSYYISVKHRNSLETWSSVPQFLNLSSLYSFTGSANLAYGNNMAQVDASPVTFAAYSGDANQDGTVDLTDGGLIDNDIYNFLSGYLPTDINGDGTTDITDASIADNNTFNFVSVMKP